MFNSYYMYVVREDDHILHLRRNPTWRSLVLFIILWFIVHFLSTQAQYPYLGYICYALGLWFCYLSTEKFEECIFDKNKSTVTMMNARFLQKFTIGYNRKIVSELTEVIGVTTQSVKPTIFGTAHQVVLIYITGLTLSITASAMYGNKKLHKKVENRINKFLNLAESPFDNDDDNNSADDKYDNQNSEVKKKTN